MQRMRHLCFVESDITLLLYFDWSVCYSILYYRSLSYVYLKAGLEEAQAGIKIAERNINNLRYADDTTLLAESEEELKSLLMKVKE